MNNLPTVDIKGKDYVLVKDRIIYFHANYIKPSVKTTLLSKPEDKQIVIKATISYEHSPGFRCEFDGHSQTTVGDGYINKTAALENAETSAVGRALAMAGIGVIDSVSSADEMNKAICSTGATQTQNLPPRNDVPVKKVQRDEEPPLPDFNDEAEQMARIMDGEVVVKRGIKSDEPSPFPKFRDCPHDNTQHSSYYKCYACYTGGVNNPKV